MVNVALFCPVDKVGKVDVLLASHHGLQFSNSPPQVESLQPKIVIIGNAINKGDDPDRVKSYMANPRFQGVWHLHVSRGHDELDGEPPGLAAANPMLLPRLLELVYWPAVQMLTWGFLQLYID